MRLYRVMQWDEKEENGIFYDATISLENAIADAQEIKRMNPKNIVTVEAEEWPEMTPVKYYLFKLFGLSEGFGVNFKTRHGYKITETKMVFTASLDR